MLRRGFACMVLACLLATTAYAQQPNFGYTPPPDRENLGPAGAYARPATQRAGGPLPAGPATTGDMSGAVRQASAQVPADPVPTELFERARKWRPNEPLDSRFAPTFYKRAKPSHLPPHSLLNQPGFVPEVRTKSTWRDGLSWLTALFN